MHVLVGTQNFGEFKACNVFLKERKKKDVQNIW